MADGTDANWGLAGPWALRRDRQAARAAAAASAAAGRSRRGVQAGVLLLHGLLLVALIEAMALRDVSAPASAPDGPGAPLVIEFDLAAPQRAVSEPRVESGRESASRGDMAVPDAGPAPGAPVAAAGGAVPGAFRAPPGSGSRQSTTVPATLDTSRLFDAEGRPRLSRSVLDAAARAGEAPAPAWREHVPEVPAQFRPRRSTVPYAPTRFDRVWAPSGESLGQALMRRSIVSRKVRTPWGTVWECGGSLFLPVLVGCADRPPRPLDRPPAGPGEAPRSPQYATPWRDPLGD